MADINLVGTQHHEPRIRERTQSVIQDNDFESLFVEGVNAGNAGQVEKVFARWAEKIEEQTGMQLPTDTGDNGYFEEAQAAEDVYTGEIHYLDTTKSVFLNIQSNVKDDLKKVARGEMQKSPGILIEEDVTKEQVKGLLRAYSPDPDMAYHLFIGDMEEQEYREHMAEAALGLFQETVAEAGHELTQEQEDLIYGNILEKAPSQEELKNAIVNDVYDGENEQEREDTWMERFNENYEGEKTGIFTGLAHLDENSDSFYNKLLDEGYEVDRYVLKDFTQI